MTVEPELSRPFAVEHLGDGGIDEHIVASPAERATVAQRLDLLSLDRLEATLSLRLAAGATLLKVTGQIDAAVVQSCVVTLEPVPELLSLPVEITYALIRSTPVEGEENVDPDAPEPLPSGGLDLGEEVVQMLSLGLDPYPRAPGATLPEAASTEPEHPFAKLREFKPRS